MQKSAITLQNPHKPNIKCKNEGLYRLLALSHKKIIKKKAVKLQINPIHKVPFFLQPIHIYRVIGDFLIQDSIFKESTTYKSNCLLFQLNSFKKVRQISIDKNSSILSITLSSFKNDFSPKFELLINRLASLSNYQAKCLSSFLLSFYQSFASFGVFLMEPTPMVENPDIVKAMMNEEFLKNIDQTKPFLMFNTGFNHIINSFETYEIKMNELLISILGYKPEEMIESCLRKGLPSIFIFENYFESMMTILDAKLSDPNKLLRIKLITADEGILEGETRFHVCKNLIGKEFYCCFVFEFNVFEWSMMKNKGKNRISQKKGMIFGTKENNKEIEDFLRKFYLVDFDEKFKDRICYRQAGYEEIKN